MCPAKDLAVARMHVVATPDTAITTRPDLALCFANRTPLAEYRESKNRRAHDLPAARVGDD
jgi:hypothetical protein